MKKYLLDTNICVYFLWGKYSLDQKIRQVGWDSCYISEITVAELKYGAELGRRKSMHQHTQELDRFLSHIHILPISDVLDLFATEKVRLRLAGTPAEDNFDLLIGCTAIVHGLYMVTENVKDFKNILNIRIENWIGR